MKLRVKKLHPDAVIPSYAKPGDAAMDLTAVSIESIQPGQITYGLGISVEIPHGHVGLIFPRSSICKYGLSLTNSVGVIDSGYRGELKAVFNQLTGEYYAPGDRIGQLMIIPYPTMEVEEVNELSATDRGEGGFGSTGR